MRRSDPYTLELDLELRRGIGLVAVLAGLLLAATTLPRAPSTPSCLPCQRPFELSVSTP